MPSLFEEPVFDETKKGYCFHLLSPPTFTASVPSSGPYTLPPDCSGSVFPFFTEFLSQSAQYFSRPLTLSKFCSRLQNIWQEHDIPVVDLAQTPFVEVQWSPAEIWFYQFQYEVHWVLQEFRPGEPVPVSPSVIIPSAPIPAETLEPPQEEEVPFQPEPRTDKEIRERLKKKIRKARLRALLTQLRAEKLAEQFYLRYGEAALDDSDSDVSFDSEQETGKI